MILLSLVLAMSAPENPVDAVEACRSVADSDQRLACFERTVAALAAARARRDLVVVDRTQMRDTRKRLFGFTLPSFKIFGGDDKDDAAEAVKQIEGKIAKAVPLSYGEYALTLEDGSVWRTTQDAPGFYPRRGDPVTIKRAVFGYMIRIGAYSTRIERTR